MVPLPLARDDRASRRLLDMNPDTILSSNDALRTEYVDLVLGEGVFCRVTSSVGVFCRLESSRPECE